ncbi:MAG: HYExAFE family protein [Zavarzinella sp.]
MDRGNHYETAFEGYLRDRRLSYIAVDESRRTLMNDEGIKSVDFLVHSREGGRLLIDIKGRKFPYICNGTPRYTWHNWVNRRDISDLLRWQESFGEQYLALIVFMYWLGPMVDLPAPTPDLWHWKGARYLVRAVAVEDYAPVMSLRSEVWDTMHVSTEAFRDLVRPFSDFLVDRKALANSNMEQ